jgi:hypothetical protein
MYSKHPHDHNPHRHHNKWWNELLQADASVGGHCLAAVPYACDHETFPKPISIPTYYSKVEEMVALRFPTIEKELFVLPQNLLALGATCSTRLDDHSSSLPQNDNPNDYHQTTVSSTV